MRETCRREDQKVTMGIETAGDVAALARRDERTTAKQIAEWLRTYRYPSSPEHMNMADAIERGEWRQ